jgi:hypothetical protein
VYYVALDVDSPVYYVALDVDSPVYYVALGWGFKQIGLLEITRVRTTSTTYSVHQLQIP